MPIPIDGQSDEKSVEKKAKLEEGQPLATSKTTIYVSAKNFSSPRMMEMKKLNQYYKNIPPYPDLDADDPDREKRRVPVGIAREIIQKRVGLLLGRAKFSGSSAFTFKDKKFDTLMKKVWDDNKLTKRMRSFHRKVLTFGCSAWKLVVDPLAEVKYRFNLIPADQIFVEFNPGEDRTIFNVKMWIIMYERPDKTYYREEITKESFFIYEGKLLSETESKEKSVAVAGVEQPIEFTLTEKVEHNYGMFPFIFMARNEDEQFWGEPLIESILSRIDRINEIFTNSFHSIKHQADPQMVVKGAKKSELFKDSDAVWFFENKDVNVQILTWEGVNEPTFKMVRETIDQCYKESDVPPILNSGEQSIADIPSRSLEILYTDAINAIEGERDDYECMWNEMFKLTAKAADVTADSEIQTDSETESDLETQTDDMYKAESIVWGGILPVNADENVDRATKLYTTGLVTKRVALEMTGLFDEEKINEILKGLEVEASLNETPTADSEPVQWSGLPTDVKTLLTEAGYDEEKWNSLSGNEQADLLDSIAPEAQAE